MSYFSLLLILLLFIFGKIGQWLNSTLTLHEQGVGLEDGVVLKKKFFVTDANVDTDNPAQVHFVYIQVA
jgi:talin